MCLTVDESRQWAAVGCDSGRIRVVKYSGKEIENVLFDNVVHKNRVMGLRIDSNMGYLYSIGIDGKIKIVNPEN